MITTFAIALLTIAAVPFLMLATLLATYLVVLLFVSDEPALPVARIVKE